MKRSNNSKRQQKQKKDQQSSSSATTEQLSSFSLAAALTETKSVAPEVSVPPPVTTTRRSIFNLPTNYSQHSFATTTSFATANESFQQLNDGTTAPAAASYFGDSSDEETTDTDTGFGNDPLSVVLSRSESTSTTTPTEISFNTNNPEETTSSTTIMASKSTKKTTKMSTKMSKKDVAPVVEEAAPVVPPAAPAVETITTEAPTKEDPKVLAETADSDAPHFDVAQNVYGTAKNVWAWGKTVPLVSNILGLTEAVASKVLDTAVHMDLPALDQEAVVPQLKRLDDDLVTPVIAAVWRILEPAFAKGEEMVVKPVMKEVVPRILAPLAMFDGGKKKEEEKMKKAKIEEEKKSMIDASPTPEIVPLNLN